MNAQPSPELTLAMRAIAYLIQQTGPVTIPGKFLRESADGLQVETDTIADELRLSYRPPNHLREVKP